jgi:peptidyl-prolyl cis-trans isomerase SurA
MKSILYLCLTLTGADRVLVDRVVAVINDEVVTLSELNAAAGPLLEGETAPERIRQIQTSSLDNLIAEKLIQQQIREARLDVTEEDVERAIDDICRQNGLSRDDLQQAIESRGMSMSQYRSDLEKQLVRLKLVDLKVRSRVVVSDTDVRAEWERMVAAEKRERLVKLRHMVFNWGESPDPAEKKRVLERAAKARGRVTAGEDFAAVAKELSEGPTATEGGDLGWLVDTKLLPEMSRVVMKMSPGQVSAPIETPGGVHLVLVEEAKLKEPEGFEQQRALIYQRMYQQEVERQMRLWIDELRAQSSVQVRLPG